MKTLIIAPHADDELLGCGGTLLRRVAEGDTVAWLLMTSITEDGGWDLEQIQLRANEIDRVRKGLNISEQNLYELGFNAADLDSVPMNTLVSRISEVFIDYQPNEVFIPYPGDVHSDHRLTFQAASACTKWFRYPSVKRVLAYETPSETDFGIDPRDLGFRPNVFIDVNKYMKRKLDMLCQYESEMGVFPFPRSKENIKSLAAIRGSQSGCQNAEAFMLLKEIQ